MDPETAIASQRSTSELLDTLAGIAHRARAASESPPRPVISICELMLPNENALSRVFRWLLDAKGSHGRAGLFLHLFVERFVSGDSWQNAEPDWSGTVVSCEVSTQCGGRIDILLRTGDGRHGVAIENKPWANWQPRQLARYRKDLCRRANHVAVVALIGHCLDPMAETQSHWGARARDGHCPDNVKGFTYDEVVRWLNDCAVGAGDLALQAFLKDLATYCRQHATLEGAMAQSIKNTTDAILASADRIGAALEVEAVMIGVRQELARRLVSPLKEALPGWQVSTEGVLSGKTYGVWVAPPAFRDGIWIYLFGPLGRSAWAGIEHGASKRLCGDLDGEASSGYRWWRYLSEGELGVQTTEAWRASPETLATSIARLVTQWVAD